MINFNTRRLRAAALATAIAAGGIGAAFVANTGGASSDDASVAVFDTRTDLYETFLDLGEEGFSDGDIIVEHAGVVDPESGESVGRTVTRLHVVEARVEPSEEDPAGDFLFHLDCTIELAGGNVYFGGSAEHADLMEGMTFTILGGTGNYAGASGTVTVQATEIDGQGGGLLSVYLLD